MSLVRSACHMWCWWPSVLLRRGVDAHPLGALELPPLLAEARRAAPRATGRGTAGRSRRTRSSPGRAPTPAGPRACLARHVHDVQRRAGEVRQHDRAVGGLLLHLPGPGDAVVVRCLLAGIRQLRRQHVDGGAVLGVHHRRAGRSRARPASPSAPARRQVEDARVGHEELEARDALVDEVPASRRASPRRRRPRSGGSRSRSRSCRAAFSCHGREAVLHALAVPLHGEVDDGCRTPPQAAACGSPVSNVSERVGAAEGQLHVRVRVDAAGDHVLAGGVDDRVDGCVSGRLPSSSEPGVSTARRSSRRR